jgi:DivIVA domain-containing protein
VPQHQQEIQVEEHDRPTRVAEAKDQLGFGGLLRAVPPEIRDVSFATVVRGYHRAEVDAYVEQVNRVIAELEIGHSPQSAVKHALDRVGEQTSGVLQRAREVAEELTTTALAESQHATRRAKVEAEETIENARAQAQELREEASREAQELLARAREQADGQLKRAEERSRLTQREAEIRLGSLHGEIEAATNARRALLDELRQTAVEIEQFASAAMAEQSAAASTEPVPEAPTEKLPARTAAGAARARVAHAPAKNGEPRGEDGQTQAEDGEAHGEDGETQRGEAAEASKTSARGAPRRAR